MFSRGKVLWFSVSLHGLSQLGFLFWTTDHKNSSVLPRVIHNKYHYRCVGEKLIIYNLCLGPALRLDSLVESLVGKGYLIPPCKEWFFPLYFISLPYSPHSPTPSYWYLWLDAFESRNFYRFSLNLKNLFFFFFF